jgi:hypothetical protein
MMIEGTCSSETSVYNKPTQLISEDGILHSYRCEYLKSYIEGKMVDVSEENTASFFREIHPPGC